MSILINIWSNLVWIYDEQLTDSPGFLVYPLIPWIGFLRDAFHKSVRAKTVALGGNVLSRKNYIYVF